jgi:membrane protein DedA with SNARE-associated domain
VLGQVLWVVLYVMLGCIFSGRVQAIAQVLGYFAWVTLGFIVTVILGWRIVRYLRSQNWVNA